MKFLFASLFFLVPTVSFAAAQYTPLEPLPFVTANMGELTFADLLSGLFKLSLVLGAAITAVMLTIGGVQYMFSDAAGSKQAGKDRIRNATLGFLLLFGIYAILNTISPELLKFNVGGIVNVGCPASDPGRCEEKKTPSPEAALTVRDANVAPPDPNVYVTYTTSEGKIGAIRKDSPQCKGLLVGLRQRQIEYVGECK